MPLPRRLSDVLDRISRAPRLLVACDFDGTLSSIVEDPGDALPHRESMASLHSLAGFPMTDVAVLSGRSFEDLAIRLADRRRFHLVGSHGAEFQSSATDVTRVEVADRLRTLRAEVARLVERFPGSTTEEKPYGIAFHYRNVTPERSEAALTEALDASGVLPGVTVKRGKSVVDFSVVSADKGAALEQLRRSLRATHMLIIGDDLTDEDSFSVARPGDVTIRVGAGSTLASYTVDTVEDVARVLARVTQRRELWMGESPAEPIEHHSLLSNLRALALVQSDARITWMCAPRPDSPAVFAQLLGSSSDGYFSVVPTDGREILEQRYGEDSMVLETTWSGLTVTDFFEIALEPSVGEVATTPSRLMRILEGHCDVRVEFAPRPDFGRIPCRLQQIPDGVELLGGEVALRLISPGVSWSIVDDGGDDLAVATVALTGAAVSLIVEFADDLPPETASSLDVPASLEATIGFWHRWMDRLEIPTIAPEEARRSALLLKSLCYAPTGAILAAATTSLPEEIGGGRNWDYRMCWPRDGSMAATTLAMLGSVTEGEALLDWLVQRIADLDDLAYMRPVYPINGEHSPVEEEIESLRGYRDSRPVRVGNEADTQVQADIFGPITTMIHVLVERGVQLTESRWGLIEHLVETVSRLWTMPDFGIWEERQAARHHLYSKVMCWQTVDRAIQIAEATGRNCPTPWRPLRDEIASTITTGGWNPDAVDSASTRSDGSVDAADLHLGLSGLLPPADPWFIAIVDSVKETLRVGPTVYRYTYRDGNLGGEGGFHICTTWLIRALLLVGREAEATALFHDLIDLAGPTGLLSEEYEPYERNALGNIPQAYSHLGLIDAARALSAAVPGDGHWHEEG